MSSSDDPVVEIRIIGDTSQLSKAFKQGLDEFKKFAGDIQTQSEGMALFVQNGVSQMEKSQAVMRAKLMEETQRRREKFTAEWQKGINQEKAAVEKNNREIASSYEKMFSAMEKSESAKILATERAEKEITRLHAEALRENSQLDKEYFARVIAQQKETTAIRMALNKDAAISNDMYLKSLGVVSATGGGGSGAGNGLSGTFSGGLLGGALGKGFVGPLATMYAGFKAFEGIKGSIGIADDIRDVDAAIRAYSKSAADASHSIDFLNKAEDRTRLTSLELKRIFLEILPKGTSAGLAQKTVENASVELANIANFRDTSANSLTTGLAQVLGGARIVGTNPLLRALGITIEQIKEIKANGDDVIQYVLNKMHALNKEAEKQGDTLGSMLKKVSFDMGTSIAEGWNYARGASAKGMDDLKTMVNDPAFRGILQTLGTTMAVTVQLITAGIGNFLGIVKILIYDINGGIHSVLSGLGTAIEWIEKLLMKIPGAGGLAKQIHAVAGDFGKLEAASAVSAFQQANDEIEKMGKRSQDLLETLKNVINGKGVPQAGNFKPLDNNQDDKDNGVDPLAKRKEEARDRVDRFVADLEDRIKVVKAEADVATEAAQNFKGTPLEAFFMFQKDLASDALAVDKAMDQMAGSIKLLGQNAPEVVKLRVAVSQLGTEMDKVAETKYNIRFPTMMDNIFAKQNTKDQQEQMKGLARGDHAELLQFRKQAQDQAKDYAQALKESIKSEKVFEGALSDVIAALMQGGENAGKAFQKAIRQVLGTGVNDMVKYVLGKLTGIEETDITDPNDPSKTVKGYKNTHTGEVAGSFAELAAKNPKYQTVSKSLIGITAGYTAYQGGLSGNKGANSAGAMSGAMAGFEISGTLMGAAIGAVVGGLLSALGKQQARADYKYGIPLIDSAGTSHFTNTKNIEPDDIKKMNSRIQDAFDTSWNSWMQVLMKAEGSILPKLSEINGRFQSNPSAHFLDNFETWLTRKLPDTIAGEFQKGMEGAAVALGMSADKFNSLWKKFSVLDPSKQVEIWGTIFDTLDNFKKLQEFYGDFAVNSVGGTGRHRTVSSSAPPPTTSYQQHVEALRADNSKSFVDRMMDSDKDIYRQIDAVSHLTGQAQINQIKQVSDLMTQRMDKEIAYYQELIQLSDDIKKDVNNMIDDLTAEGFKKPDGSADYQKQAEFWRNRADEDLTNLQNAKTPEAVRQAWADYLADLDKVKQAQSQMGPENAEAVRKWMITALTIGNDFFQKKIDSLGDAVSEADKYFKEHVAPFMTDFTTSLTTLNGGIGDVTGGLDDFNQGISDSTGGLHVFAPAVIAAGDALGKFTEKINSIKVNPNGDDGNGDDGGHDHGNDFYYISYYGYNK